MVVVQRFDHRAPAVSRRIDLSGERPPSARLSPPTPPRPAREVERRRSRAAPCPSEESCSALRRARTNPRASRTRLSSSAVNDSIASAATSPASASSARQPGLDNLGREETAEVRDRRPGLTERPLADQRARKLDVEVRLRLSENLRDLAEPADAVRDQFRLGEYSVQEEREHPVQTWIEVGRRIAAPVLPAAVDLPALQRRRRAGRGRPVGRCRA